MRLGALSVFEIVRREGAEEMLRPARSLWWSALAAGVALSFSAATMGMIEASTPEGPMRDLLKPFGYVIGFLIIVFGRLQLFTENTIAAVLPLAARVTATNVKNLARLWTIVLAANVVGASLAALVMSCAPVLTEAHLAGVISVAEHALEPGWAEILAKAIPAGFLVAAMVWMLPSAKGAEFFVVTAIIYVLALAELAHVIVGTTEAALLVIAGAETLRGAVLGFSARPDRQHGRRHGAVRHAVLWPDQGRDARKRGRRREATLRR